MEQYLDFFNSYIMGGVQILTEFIFFTKFLGKKRHVLYCTVCSILGLLVLEAASPGGPVFGCMLLLAAYGISVYRADPASAFLYAVITVCVMQLCYGIVNAALYMLYPSAFLIWRERTGIVFMFLGYAALLPAVCGYRLISRHFCCRNAVRNRYVLLLLLPVLVIFFVGNYISCSVYGNVVTVETEGDFAAGRGQTGRDATAKDASSAGDGRGNIIAVQVGRNMGKADHCWILAIQVLGLASLFSILAACRKLLENFRLSTEFALLLQEERYLHQYVEEAKEHDRKTKSLRHDIRNHITVIRQLLQSGNTEQALCYIGDLDDMAEEMSFPCHTGHPAADILIEQKLAVAKSSGIEADCSLVLPCPCAVRDIDFSIILSNALDNAICACRAMDSSEFEREDGTRHRKYIHISGRRQGDFVLLKVENSFDGKKEIRKGTGLSNMEAVVKKYQGAMDIRMEGNRFLLSVLLNTAAEE